MLNHAFHFKTKLQCSFYPNLSVPERCFELNYKFMRLKEEEETKQEQKFKKQPNVNCNIMVAPPFYHALYRINYRVPNVT